MIRQSLMMLLGVGANLASAIASSYLIVLCIRVKIANHGSLVGWANHCALCIKRFCCGGASRATTVFESDGPLTDFDSVVSISTVVDRDGHLYYDFLTTQLLALGAADVPFHVSGCLIVLFDTEHTFSGLDPDLVCGISYYVYRRCRFIAILVECHMALSFLGRLAFRSWSAANIRFMMRITFWVFMGIATALSFVDARAFPASFNGELCVLKRDDVVASFMIAAVFCITLTSYVCLMVSSFFAGKDRLTRRSLRLFALYPLNFIFSYGPVLVLYTNKRLWHLSIFFTIVEVSEGLSGVFNVLVYMYQAHDMSAALLAMSSRLATEISSVCETQGLGPLS